MLYVITRLNSYSDILFGLPSKFKLSIISFILAVKED